MVTKEQLPLKNLKIIIHDYAGHPFQLELSKQLSKKFIVYHFYYQNDYGPKADFKDHLNDKLKIKGIGKNISYDKNNFITRFFKDLEYGKEVSKQISEIKPDIVISGNCPTLAQELIIKSCHKNNSKFVIWVQDFYSHAVKLLLKKKISFFSYPISFLFEYLEKKQLNQADKLIIISNNWVKKLSSWNVENKKIHYIPNWGDIKNIKYLEKKPTSFLDKNSFEINKFKIIYTGTLALKHNPKIITNIAINNKDIDILVIGAGSGFQKLKNMKNIPLNIKMLPLQPYKKMSDILNSADVLLGILSKDASKFSVPSKILNYLCAGKPIILSAPKDNLAATIISESKSGKTFEPQDLNGINNFLKILMTDSTIRQKYSLNARDYDENNFKIEKISLKFENIINNLNINK